MHRDEKVWIFVLVVLVALVAIFLLNNQSMIKTGLIGGGNVKIVEEHGSNLAVSCVDFKEVKVDNSSEAINLQGIDTGANDCTIFSNAVSNTMLMNGSKEMVASLYKAIRECAIAKGLFFPGVGTPGMISSNQIIDQCKIPLMNKLFGKNEVVDRTTWSPNDPNTLKCPPYLVNRPVTLSLYLPPPNNVNHQVTCVILSCGAVSSQLQCLDHFVRPAGNGFDLVFTQYTLTLLGGPSGEIVGGQEPPTLPSLVGAIVSQVDGPRFV